MERTLRMFGDSLAAWLLAWLHVICAPLLLLGPLHPVTPGHPFNPIPSLQEQENWFRSEEKKYESTHICYESGRLLFVLSGFDRDEFERGIRASYQW